MATEKSATGRKKVHGFLVHGEKRSKRLSYDIANISKTTTPIDKKFQDNIWTTKMCPAMQYCDVITNPRWRTAAILKIVTVMWPKIEIFGIQDGGYRHLENCFFGHYLSIDCRISAKFCMRKQNGMLTRATEQKCKCVKSKMADGRHFENR